VDLGSQQFGGAVATEVTRVRSGARQVNAVDPAVHLRLRVSLHQHHHHLLNHRVTGQPESSLKLAFHDADTDTDILTADILARIVAIMSATRRVVQLATGITSIARVGEDPREEVVAGVGVVECELNSTNAHRGEGACMLRSGWFYERGPGGTPLSQRSGPHCPPNEIFF